MRPTRWLSLLLFVTAACNAGDDTTDGARALCAEGGALNTCPEAPHTAEGACWRLVDCAAIPLDSMNNFDWSECVNRIEGLTATREELVIDCVASSTCDALKPDPNSGDIACLKLGGL